MTEVFDADGWSATVVEANTLSITSRPGAGSLDVLTEWARRNGYRTLLASIEPEDAGGYAELGFSDVARERLPEGFAFRDGSAVVRRDLLGVVGLRPSDPAWPAVFGQLRTRIVQALGPQAVAVEHVGSTSVPGLAAKPVIDIALVVPDSADETAYVPGLERIGYSLTFREPEWFEHRLLNRDWPRVNLHVFSGGCSEVAQMTGFRDWLRTHADDRELYERTKRELAGRTWAIVQDYADAKTDVVGDIKRRAGLVGD